MSIFRRLIRDNAQSVDRVGIDQVNPPPVLEDRLWHVEHEHVPNRMSGHRGVIVTHASIAGPVSLVLPHPIPSDAPPALVTTYHDMARRGEGLWGMEPFMPEGTPVMERR